MLTDTDSKVRAASMDALAGETEFGKSLCSGIKYALVANYTVEDITYLVRYVEDKDKEVRLASFMILSRLELKRKRSI
jgi:hypothetical protein